MKRYHNPAQIKQGLCLPNFATITLFVGVFILLMPLLADAAPRMNMRGKLINPGQLVIGGVKVRCGATPALISNHYPDFGAARRGLIILNPVKLRSLSRDAKLLIYYHECAHQYVGGRELAADCWAVQKVRREGLMDIKGLKNACSFIERLPANGSHPSGKTRCRQMVRCYNNTYRRNVDRGRQFKKPAAHMASRRGFSRRWAPRHMLRAGRRR